MAETNDVAKGMAVTKNLPCIVKYKDDFYVAYKVLGGRAHLIDRAGNKYSGTPGTSQLIMVKPLATKLFNKIPYFRVKQGVFSGRTGNKIQMPEILKMFSASTGAEV